MIEADEVKRLRVLEGHYRPCACRSCTPFFASRAKPEVSRHVKRPDGTLYRTTFQHDRDKILYTRSFRRLRLKTQIFPEDAGDDLRTRLDHTLEVTQVARHLARQLRLNEDLADAISLGHDLGHPPFGHSGERALHRILRGKAIVSSDLGLPVCDGFRHNWQGLRKVDLLEKSYPEIDGLNLTNAVRMGILLHTGISWRAKDFIGEDGTCCRCDIEMEPDLEALSNFEVQICRLADDLCQVVHDFEDAIISGTLSLRDLLGERKKWPLLGGCLDEIEREFREKGGPPEWSCLARLGPADYPLLLVRIRSQLIYALTDSAVSASEEGLTCFEEGLGADREQRECAFNEHVRSGQGFPDCIRLGKLQAAFAALKDRVQAAMHHSARIARMDGKAEYVLSHAFEVYITQPQQVPNEVLAHYASMPGQPQYDELRQWRSEEWDRHLPRGPRLPSEEPNNTRWFMRALTDHLADMTDRQALMEYDQLYSAHPRKPL